MNTMDKLPENMSRVLVLTNDNILDFFYYKDGMFRDYDDRNWYQPSKFKGWLSIKDLKETLNIKCFKLIGYGLDTNQVKVDNLETLEDIKYYLNKIIDIYSEDMFNSMRLVDRTFTAYSYHLSNPEQYVTLNEFLNKN